MMRISPLLAVLCLAPGLVAQKQKKDDADAKTRLTAKEVADGWLYLFDGETTFGWHIDGEAKVDKGKLILGGKKATKARVTTRFPHADGLVQFEASGAGPLRYSVLGQEHTERLARPTTVLVKGPRGDGKHVPLTFDIPANTRVALSAAMLRPLHLTPLFNGKDLTGWKVFKGNPKQEKSKFTVTKEGWLNVKDGPGDLQTEKTFDNFALQLDCISNGTRLNSGVFFRCLPDKYQQGYEAQVHNGWLDKPKTIAVDDYDPKAMKAFKRQVTTTAMDFGTGAIYRRQPARRAVAKDNEWFTMTVVADGRHLATWVNGVQQVDWTDNRPPNDNARQGYRAKAGAISIQGHDPTTDLSFRNIRVAPLP